MDSELEKIASFYDGLGRNLARQMMKTARKLPPGMFSGKKGLAKVLGLGTLGAGGFALGKSSGKTEGKKDDVAIANQAYKAGMRRGAMAVIQKLRQSGFGG
jgi:hypothetical protein